MLMLTDDSAGHRDGDGRTPQARSLAVARTWSMQLQLSSRRRARATHKASAGDVAIDELRAGRDAS